MEQAADFLFPLEERYIAFGDGSETSAGAFFGFVLIPVKGVEAALKLLTTVKLKYGGGADSNIAQH